MDCISACWSSRSTSISSASSVASAEGTWSAVVKGSLWACLPNDAIAAPEAYNNNIYDHAQ